MLTAALLKRYSLLRMMDGSDTYFQLLASSKAAALKAGFADFKHVASTGSTNDDLVAEARKGVLSSCVLVADTQTAGRGRLDRHWRDSGMPAGSSPVGSSRLAAGSLLVSFRFPCLLTSGAPAQTRRNPAQTLSVVQPEVTHSGITQPDTIAVAASAAVIAVAASAISAVASFGVKVLSKWPNDLVVEYPHVAGKLAGILAEVVETEEHVIDPDVMSTAPAVVPSTAVVVGLGLNLLPLSSEPGAVSLAEVGTDVDRDRLLSRVLDFLPGFISNPTRSLNIVKSTSSTIGHMVKVKQMKGGVIIGRARDIDSQGRLTVDLNTGTVSVSAFDVEHLRPE